LGEQGTSNTVDADHPKRGKIAPEMACRAAEGTAATHRADEDVEETEIGEYFVSEGTIGTRVVWIGVLVRPEGARELSYKLMESLQSGALPAVTRHSLDDVNVATKGAELGQSYWVDTRVRNYVNVMTERAPDQGNA
jgi:hypothetical protein